MKVFYDVFTGDELFSDSYPMVIKDDIYYEIEGKNITESNEIDEALIGGNKAPEGSEAAEEDGAVQSSAVTGINVVLTHRLFETSFDKAAFKDWIKTYSKRLKEHLEKQNHDSAYIAKFQAGITKFAKDILTNFKEYRFYLGESVDLEGMVVFQFYRSNGETPVFIFVKDGLREEKY